MEIEVKSIIGTENAIEREDANKVEKFIIEALQNNQVINVSFKGIKITTPSFLNVIVGDLFSNYTREQVDNLVKFSNYSKNTGELIEIIKNEAEKYFAERKNDNI